MDVVILRLKPIEKKLLKAQARRCGISSSDYVRVAINQYFLVKEAARRTR